MCVRYITYNAILQWARNKYNLLYNFSLGKSVRKNLNCVLIIVSGANVPIDTVFEKDWRPHQEGEKMPGEGLKSTSDVSLNLFFSDFQLFIIIAHIGRLKWRIILADWKMNVKTEGVLGYFYWIRTKVGNNKHFKPLSRFGHSGSIKTIINYWSNYF